ncbi:unnamed protein product, partial [Auanema sp. JU1783]
MTVNAFAAKLNQLGLIAFDHTDHHRDNVLRAAFLGGLNENIRREVQRAKPKTYREAVEAARFEEGILRRETQEDVLINALNKALTPFTQQLENTERSLRNMENNPWRETREPKNENFTRGFGRRPFNGRRNGFYPKNHTNSYRGYQPNAYNRERHDANQFNNNTIPNFQRLPNPNPRGFTNEDSRGGFQRNERFNGGNRGGRFRRAVNALVSPLMLVAMISVMMTSFLPTSGAYQLCTRAKGGILLVPPQTKKCEQIQPAHL